MSACCNYKNAVQNLLKYHSHWAGSSAGMLAYAYRIRLPLIGQAMCEHSVPALIFSVGVCLLIFHHCLWPESWTRPAAPLMILYYAVASVIIMNLAHLLVWQACLLLLRLLLRGAAHGLFQINEIAALGKGSVIAAGGEALLEQSRRSCLPMALSGFLLLWVFHAIGVITIYLISQGWPTFLSLSVKNIYINIFSIKKLTCHMP